jgi:hypothetical protein
VAICLAGYLLTINTFFSGDDFFLLRQSKAGWSLFQKSDFAYYRPITLLVWFCQYQLWQLQPVFYHLLSLFFHIGNSLLVALLLNLVAGNQKYGALAACLFCAYPVHPEAVSWLAGEFDLLSTTGQLLSFICLIKAYQVLPLVTSQLKKEKKEKKYSIGFWLLWSLLAYLLALLNKEAALFLPVVVASYLLLEIIINTPVKKRQSLVWGLAVCGLYLAISLGYFAVRGAVLTGSSSTDEVNYNYFSFIWWALAEAYEVLIAPINQVLLANHQTFMLLLLLICNLLFLASLLYSFISAFKQKNIRLILTLVFSLIWSVAAIMPALAVNYIRTGWQGGDLEGSRVLYSASMGVCAILAIAFSEFAEWSIKILPFLTKPRVLLTCSMIVLTFYLVLLNLNNLAWVEAGKWTAQIQQGFSQVVPLATASGHDLMKSTEPGVGVVLIGLPDNYKGAYAAHNMFNFQNNFGQVFYNIEVPAAQIDLSAENTLDYSKLDFKVLYLAKFAIIKDSVELQSVQQLNKGFPPITLLDKIH